MRHSKAKYLQNVPLPSAPVANLNQTKTFFNEVISMDIGTHLALLSLGKFSEPFRGLFKGSFIAFSVFASI